MNVLAFEPMLRDATIKALDAVGRRLAGAEVTRDNPVTRLLDRWNALSRAEKENVATVIIATTTTAVAAIAALKGGKKRARKVGKKVARGVGRRVAR